MEMRALKYFVAVAKQLSFSRAADSLYVSQSNLSKQIAALENELGVLLFIRKNRSIELTPAGQLLMEKAEHIFNQIDALAGQVRQVGQSLPQRQSLTLSLEEPVSANVDVCQQIVAVLQDLKREYKDVQISFHYESRPELGDRFSNEEADIYFRVASEAPGGPEYQCELLSEDRFVMVAAQSLVDQLAEPTVQELLRNYPLLALGDDGRSIIDICRMLADIDCKPDIHFSKNDYTMVLELSTECGVALVPGKKAAEITGNGLIALPIDAKNAAVSLYALYEKKNSNPLVVPFLEELKKRL